MVQAKSRLNRANALAKKVAKCRKDVGDIEAMMKAFIDIGSRFRDDRMLRSL